MAIQDNFRMLGIRLPVMISRLYGAGLFNDYMHKHVVRWVFCLRFWIFLVRAFLQHTGDSAFLDS
jgi:hypothetical protein